MASLSRRDKQEGFGGPGSHGDLPTWCLRACIQGAPARGDGKAGRLLGTLGRAGACSQPPWLLPPLLDCRTCQPLPAFPAPSCASTLHSVSRLPAFILHKLRVKSKCLSPIRATALTHSPAPRFLSCLPPLPKDLGLLEPSRLCSFELCPLPLSTSASGIPSGISSQHLPVAREPHSNLGASRQADAEFITLDPREVMCVFTSAPPAPSRCPANQKHSVDVSQ